MTKLRSMFPFNLQSSTNDEFTVGRMRRVLRDVITNTRKLTLNRKRRSFWDYRFVERRLRNNLISTMCERTLWRCAKIICFALLVVLCNKWEKQRESCLMAIINQQRLLPLLFAILKRNFVHVRSELFFSL